MMQTTQYDSYKMQAKMPAKPELLAPVGDSESLIAAVENGADAVYLGAKILSARASANNFTIHELTDAIDYAHLRGVRAYITVNTLVKEREARDAADLLCRLEESGADAVIVQDMGLLAIALSLTPQLPIHASTQMTVHNSEGVRFMQDLGLKRVVLARELSLDEIKTIKEKTEIELEVFVHGALCISYSGQCLTSSMIGARSGNRGYCAQPCRKKYRLQMKTSGRTDGLAIGGRRIETDGEHLLSPKDLNTSRILPELIDSGVDSFKIEGRLKRPEYVACVVGIYRRLIDRYAEDPSGYFVSDEDSLRLAQLFNRGFTTAYFGEKPRSSLIARRRPYNRGVFAGTVLTYDQKWNHLRVRLSCELNSGDGIRLEIGSDAGGVVEAGMTVPRMYEGWRLVNHAESGAVVDIPADAFADLFDDAFADGCPTPETAIYRTLDKQLMDSLRRTFTSANPIRRIPVTISASAVVGSPFELQIADNDGNTACVRSEYVIEHAVKRPTTEGEIMRQLTKLGNTVFEASGADVRIEGDVFIPVSQLNQIRTDAVSELVTARTAGRRRPGSRNARSATHPPNTSNALNATHDSAANTEPEAELEAWVGAMAHEAGASEKPSLAVHVKTLAGVRNAISGGADVIYLGGERFRGEGAPDLKASLRYAQQRGRAIYLSTPGIAKDAQLAQVRETLLSAERLGFDGVIVSNHGVFRLAREIGLDTIVDRSFNVFNRSSLEFWIAHGAKMVTLSPELNFAEISAITPHGAAECVVHGRLTLMESEHCVVGGILGCGGVDAGMAEGMDEHEHTAPCETGEFELVDEKEYVFPLRMDVNCRTHLMNPDGLCMLGHIPGIIGTGVSSIRIDATAIDCARIEEITRLYRDAVDGQLPRGRKARGICKEMTGGYTTGHYRRGVL